MPTYPLKKLGEISIVGAGNSAPQDEDLFVDGKFPFIRTSDVGKYKISKSLIDVSDYLNSEGIKNLKLFKKGTILLPKSGASTFLNHRVIMGIDGYVSSHLATIQARKEFISPDFLFYFLLGIKAQDLIQDHKYPSLNLPVIENIQIPLPPISVQEEIVAKLDAALASIDEAKTKTQQTLAATRELWENTIETSLFSEKYEGMRLGDVCQNVEYGSSTKSEKIGKIPVLRMGNIQNSRFDWKDLVYSNDDSEIKKYKLRHNDVLFNRTNSAELVGKSAIYKSEMPAIFAGYLIRINRKTDLLDADYLNFFLNSKRTQDYGKTVMSCSVNQANINGTKLKEYIIPFPSLSEQSRIVANLDAVRAETDRLASLYEQKLADLDELRRSVLQEAFAQGT